MADTLPLNFPVPAEQAIASYDYTDIADGAGKIDFYGGNTKQTTTSTYILSENAFYSNDISTQTASVTAVGFQKYLDLDFDLSPFNTPRNLFGTALVTAGIKMYANTGIKDIYLIAKIRKYSGSTETEIASATSETNSVNNTTSYDTISVKIPITSLAHFKKGDILRLTIEAWCQVRDGYAGEGSFNLYHDPIGRQAQTDNTTQLIFKCPFKIDL